MQRPASCAALITDLVDPVMKAKIDIRVAIFMFSATENSNRNAHGGRVSTFLEAFLPISVGCYKSSIILALRPRPLVWTAISSHPLGAEAMQRGYQRRQSVCQALHPRS